MLYNRYDNEAAFRTQFIQPLLTRLGYVGIDHNHGPNERGKDFVFSELTPFGFLRHNAAVVKHAEKIKQGKGPCFEIREQVRQAFTNDYQLPDSEAMNRVSGVFVFNSGVITDGAQKTLRKDFEGERFGRNVHIFDGKRLAQLDQSATFGLIERLLPRLQGILNDLKWNKGVWRKIRDQLPRFREVRGCLTGALEGFAAAPFLTDRIDTDEIIALLQECRLIDGIVKRYTLPSLGISSEAKKGDTELLQDTLQAAISRADRIRERVEAALATFEPLAPDTT